MLDFGFPSLEDSALARDQLETLHLKPETRTP